MRETKKRLRNFIFFFTSYYILFLIIIIATLIAVACQIRFGSSDSVCLIPRVFFFFFSLLVCTIAYRLSSSVLLVLRAVKRPDFALYRNPPFPHAIPSLRRHN